MDFLRPVKDKQELFLLLQAAYELNTYGKTGIACPDCGGKIKVDNKGTSFAVFCENRCCGTIGRGI